MKHTTQWVAALITVASAGFAMGCGCSSVRLAPVREQIIQSNVCAVQQPVVISRTSCVTETPSRTFWTAPSKENPAYVIGNVFTAPFRAISGRSLGEPDVVASYNYSESLLEPVGERVVTKTSLKCGKRHHLLKKVTYLKESMLMPVGERLTTVKVIRAKPLLMPVSERITTIRHIEMQPVLAPVGERIITRRYVNPWNSCDF